MLLSFLVQVALLLALLPVSAAQAAKASVLIDFDPNSAAQTVLVESIVADPKGMLYACDRIRGNIWRIDHQNRTVG
jgi:hypothetical protein